MATTQQAERTERDAIDKLDNAASAIKAYCFLLRRAVAHGDDLSDIAENLADLERPHMEALEAVGGQFEEALKEAKFHPELSPRARRLREEFIGAKAREGESAATISEVVQLHTTHVERIMRILMGSDPAFNAKPVPGRVING